MLHNKKNILYISFVESLSLHKFDLPFSCHIWNQHTDFSHSTGMHMLDTELNMLSNIWSRFASHQYIYFTWESSRTAHQGPSVLQWIYLASAVPYDGNPTTTITIWPGKFGNIVSKLASEFAKMKYEKNKMDRMHNNWLLITFASSLRVKK